jgi:hypothetical protein
MKPPTAEQLERLKMFYDIAAQATAFILAIQHHVQLTILYDLQLQAIKELNHENPNFDKLQTIQKKIENSLRLLQKKHTAKPSFAQGGIISKRNEEPIFNSKKSIINATTKTPIE